MLYRGQVVHWPDTCVVPWRSSGWNNNLSLAMMLEMLVQRGDRGVLRVDAIHQDAPFGPAPQAQLERELADLAFRLDVELLLR